MKSFTHWVSLRLMLCLLLLLTAACSRAESFVKLPAAASAGLSVDSTPQTAVLAGGCFWGMELVFSHVKGVQNVVSGYAGGAAQTASYYRVASGDTGHAEAVRFTFDPSQVSYTDLLRIYFSVAHDPTEINRQGPDSGTQYRSEIFALTADQAKLAHAYIEQLDSAKVFAKPIATLVATTQASQSAVFYPAENYHQNYAALHPDSFYIRVNDLPKLQALKQYFPQAYRAQPAKLP